MKRELNDARHSKDRSGFTLIELLVVISIIALLLSILIPALAKVKDQARATICRVHLKQWGLCYEMYLSDNKSTYTPGTGHNGMDGSGTWIFLLDSYYQDPKLRLCPKANRTETEGGVLPLAAWEVRTTNAYILGNLKLIEDEYGSYGENWWLTSGEAFGGAYPNSKKFKKTGFKGAFQVPVLGDSGFFLLRPLESDEPPATDGEFSWAAAQGNEMYRTCHDRHNGGVNWLFADGVVREIELKELWEIRWHREWVVRRNIVWPDWMK